MNFLAVFRINAEQKSRGDVKILSLGMCLMVLLWRTACNVLSSAADVGGGLSGPSMQWLKEGGLAFNYCIRNAFGL